MNDIGNMKKIVDCFRGNGGEMTMEEISVFENGNPSMFLFD
jgi:hypothetical protein